MELSQRSVTLSAICDPAERQAIVDKAIKGFRKHGTLSSAARVAKIDPRTLRSWIHNDPLMKMAFQEADEEVTDELEESAIERAKTDSDRLLIHLLASRRQRYATKITHIHEAPATHSLVEQVKQIAAAQPTMAPLIRAVLIQALEQIP